MPRLRHQHQWMDIGREEELWIWLAVEKEKELVFRMCKYNTTYRFGGEPTDTVESVGQ